MIKILGYLKTYWKEEVKISYLLIIATFLGFCIFSEYYYKVTGNFVEPLKRTLPYFYVNIIFYCIPLLFSIILYIIFYHRKDLWRNKRMWFTVIFIVVGYSFRVYFYKHLDWALSINDYKYDNFIAMSFNQITQAILIFLLVFIFWWISGDIKKMNLYGFNIKNFDVRPYFLMLFIMLPIILAASTQIDFLNYYPTY